MRVELQLVGLAIAGIPTEVDNDMVLVQPSPDDHLLVDRFPPRQLLANETGTFWCNRTKGDYQLDEDGLFQSLLSLFGRKDCPRLDIKELGNDRSVNK